MKLVLYLAACCAAVGQAESPPSFEVTSVRPVPPERQNILRTDYCTAGGRFSASGAPLQWILTFAFGIKDYQVAGAPAWVSAFDSAYEIEGKPSGAVDKTQCKLMVQSLLAERFKLVVHRESSEHPVYLLTVAKKGVKMHEAGQVKLNGSIQIDGSGKPDWPDGWTAPRLAVYLSDFAGRPVLDRTGLTAKYGVVLDFARRDGDDRPDLFTAVQEQLGLKLQPATAPIEMLVIDHIERAGSN